MIELLAIPAWDTGETTLDVWLNGLREQAGTDEISVVKEPPQGAWIELPALRIRGYAMMAGAHVEAINFEIFAVEPATGTALLERTAAAIGWEIHPDEDEDEDEDVDQ